MSPTAPLQTANGKPPPAKGRGILLQRKCTCGSSAGLSGECEECSKTKVSGIQAKLTVSEPGDQYEREADRIAEQALAAPAYPAVRVTPPRVQCLSGQPAGQVDAVPASVDQALAGPSRPLEPALQQDMEQRLGHDFSRVRIHSGVAAEHSAREVNAYAYTVGQDIVFGAGRFAPGTRDGRRLIAHELAHVVQQSRAEGIRIWKSDEKRGLSPIYAAGQDVVFGDGKYEPHTEGGRRLIPPELAHIVQQAGGDPRSMPKSSVAQDLAYRNYPQISAINGVVGTLQRQFEVDNDLNGAEPEPASTAEENPQLSALVYRVEELAAMVRAVTRDQGSPTLPERTTEVGTTWCNIDTGKPEWRIERTRIPQCMWPCAEHHEQTHAEFMRSPCETVWLPLERARFWIRIAGQYAQQGNLPEVERATREVEAAVEEGGREVQWYLAYMQQTCRYDEGTAYEAGIEVCDTVETSRRCTETGQRDQYNRHMSTWRRFMQNPPNCPAPPPRPRTP
jgi:hypothetical protein